MMTGRLLRFRLINYYEDYDDYDDYCYDYHDDFNDNHDDQALRIPPSDDLKPDFFDDHHKDYYDDIDEDDRKYDHEYCNIDDNQAP